VSIQQEATAGAIMHPESGEMTYRIGGRLDVIPTVEAAATMLRALDGAAVRLPPLGEQDSGDP
jgi:hypothetical protein